MRLLDWSLTFATDGSTWKALNRDWSYIVSERSGREELYNLVNDPGETENLVDREPEIVELGRRHVQQAMAEWRKHPYLALKLEEIEMPEEQMENLRSLGYIE